MDIRFFQQKNRGSRARTCDNLRVMQVLSQLSYVSITYSLTRILKNTRYKNNKYRIGLERMIILLHDKSCPYMPPRNAAHPASDSAVFAVFPGAWPL